MQKAGANLSFFLAGAVIGGLVAVLYAPQSGEETRKFLSQKAREGKEHPQQKAHEFQDRAVDMMERSKQAVTRETRSVSAAVDAGREAYYASRPNGAAGD